MSYTSTQFSKDSLTQYCKSHWNEIHKEQMGNPGRNFKEAAALGHTVYSRALVKGVGIAIIGPNRLRENVELVGNVGCVLGNVSNAIKRLPEDSYICAGAILGEKQWSGLINDLFMLGSVHAKKQFQFSLPSETELKLTYILNTENEHLTTTGRELLLLLLAGYVKASAKKIFGHVFFLPKGKLEEITLEQYREAIKT